MYTAITCEVCKEDFPIRMKKDNHIIDLLNYHKPESLNYVVFETLMSEQVFEERIRVYHTFEFIDQKEITIGRKLGTHCKLSDMSISDLHCSFHLIKKSEIWIEDLESKFGTLALMKKPVKLEVANYPLSLQIGRTQLTIECKLPPECCSYIIKPTDMKVGITTWMWVILVNLK
jgi:hypothetical protein